ncbi:probable 2-oxoglutarate-dependent dioxygenase SLC1 [Syzygium oleosum]|uniref:probable 2-oxoglutarate-dependent dioxygenase SLC1 n=1 Tax=Syzygium oleosum TaxID=219896 RepID=UPI0024BB4EF4|nr:probable 2-oxoglutarate-dependent dioxygenase SLC1 [Syzygium oleosum]
MGLAVESNNGHGVEESKYQRGVRHLCEGGIERVPRKYVFPVLERPDLDTERSNVCYGSSQTLKLPVIDFARLQGSNRSQVLKCLANACEEYGFFQLVNHGIPSEVIEEMGSVGRRFFELPYEERCKYMTPDMRSPVRYGTSFNQNTDPFFCWRDFLKLSCHPLPQHLPSWPSNPSDLREVAANYSTKTKFLYLKLMEAILESLGVKETAPKLMEDHESDRMAKDLENGSQIVMVNCYPACPEPDLTLGMPPHSDYGMLTLLLQDESVQGLQIHHGGRWVTVEPLPNSFVVNVGDHLEIFSNGKFKSVLHRVLVNPSSTRISIASLHSLSFDSTVRPSPKLIDEANPRRYKDTDFASFLHCISSVGHKDKNFLDTRKLT